MEDIFASYIPKTELEKFVIDYYDDLPITEWCALSTNPNITWEFKFLFKNKSCAIDPWDWNNIFVSLYIDLTIFEKYKLYTQPDIYMLLGNNDIFDLEIVYKYPDKDWNWYNLSKHVFVNHKFMITFIDKNLNWYYLFLERDNKHKHMHQNNKKLITDDFILKNSELSWNWNILSMNKNISIELINKLKDKDWNWRYITTNQDKIDDIIKYPRLPWEFYYINDDIIRDIPIKFIRRHRLKKWNWDKLVFNQVLDDKFINDYPNLPYNWHTFGPNEITSIEMLRKFSDKNLNWKSLSISTEFTPEIIEQNLDLPWDWDSLSFNPNITYSFINKHSDKPWNIANICINVFTHGGYYTYNSVGNYSESDKLNAEKNLSKFKEELIQKTWHPSRLINWCFSIDEIE